jgi:hypothetical protein
VESGKLTGWKVDGMEESASAASTKSEDVAKAALMRNFEFRLPLSWLLAAPGSAASQTAAEREKGAVPIAATSRLRLRFSLWQNRLPVDALPMEGWIELQLLSEWELASG